ncbi:hypothetical protein [Natrinema sp. CBA1119]|uniref:hypothetical protein n=1 Tax=Natrinema sp. CBA1119 TaxID=1608465 RepID=UPI0011454B2F|nr:hypothetical protein [Natrinema sp. CBA1119]
MPVSTRVIADNQVIATVFLDRVRRTNDLTDILVLIDSREFFDLLPPVLALVPIVDLVFVDSPTWERDLEAVDLFLPQWFGDRNGLNVRSLAGLAGCGAGRLGLHGIPAGGDSIAGNDRSTRVLCSGYLIGGRRSVESTCRLLQ